MRDPELRRKLTPDYEPGCKRLIMSTDFYPTVQKEHVEVVTEGIDRVEPRGIVTKDGRPFLSFGVMSPHNMADNRGVAEGEDG